MRGRHFARMGGLAALLAVSMAAALWWGETPLQWPVDATVFWSLRLPKVVLAALVGASLGASGCALQALMRNPLADPFVLGVSGGAALGATLAMALGLSSFGVWEGWQFSAVSLFSLGGAFAATVLVMALGRWAGRSLHSTLLAGVVFNSLALAVITLVKVLWAPEKGGEILYWMAGNLSHESYETLGVASVLQTLALGLLWALSGRLNVLMLGDEDAASLGVSVPVTRWAVLLAVCLSVGVSVSLAGLVGFVGLVVPHLVRAWVGPDCRQLMPASALGGASFLVLADLGARALFPVLHTVPPVGALTSLIGALFFLVLLGKKKATSSLSSN